MGQRCGFPLAMNLTAHRRFSHTAAFGAAGYNKGKARPRTNPEKRHMKPIRYSLSVVVIVAIASLVTGAEEKSGTTSTAASEHKMLDPANVAWGDPPSGLPPGGQLTVLSGNPTKKGVSTVRLRMPAGYKIPPHTHLTAELVTVISGSCHLGRGEKFDETPVKRWAPEVSWRYRRART